MDWLDDAGDDGSPSRRPALTVQAAARRWPVFAVLALSGAGLVAAAFHAPVVSTAAYVVLLVVGCGLLFYRRFDAIIATRRAGGVGVLTVQPVEKGAIAALALACLANGVVIAFEVAAWEIWA